MSDEQNSVVEVELSLRCRPHRLSELLANLNDNQKAAVTEIGFGGLLQLKLTRLPAFAAPMFLAAFNDGSQMFKISEAKDFLVRKFDVHDCFELPLGPNPLPLLPTGRETGSQDPEPLRLKDKWRKRYGIKKLNIAIPLFRLEEEIKTMKDGGDEFKRLFVLASVGLFLRPTSNKGVDMRLLRAVEDVTAINQFDWCTYVLDGMVKAGVRSKTNKGVITCGCIPFLMIAYFHRFDWRGEPVPSDLPLIKHWDDKSLLDRATAEHETRQLGRAPMSATIYPRCLQAATEQYVMVVHNENDPKPSDLAIRNTSPVPTNKTNFEPSYASSSRKYITIELPEGLEDDSELQARCIDPVHLMYLMMQRNAIVFHYWYSKTTAEIKMKTSVSNEQHVQDQCQMTQDTQAFFEDENIQRYFDEVISMANSFRDSAKKAPSFQTGTSKTHSMPGEFNVPSPSNMTTIAEEVMDEGHIADLNDTPPFRNKRNVRNEETTPDNRGASVVYVPVCNVIHHPFLLHSDRPLSCMVILPENLGCTVHCGAPDPERLVVSEALVGHKSELSTVFGLRLDVMDYVFHTAGNFERSECLVFYKQCYLIPREEMMTLLPGQQLSNAIIDCWAVLLNDLSYTWKSPMYLSRCFFGLSHSGITKDAWDQQVDVSRDVFAAWDLWLQYSVSPMNLDSDLVFIPTLSGNNDHYSCVCINFKERQLEYLDNRSYGEDFEKSSHASLARFEANLMGEYLSYKGYAKGKDVCNFNLVNVEFSWQGHGYSHNDCGVYMCLHMLLYSGRNFDCDLGLKGKNNLFRFEIAATLVLSDRNQSRNDVLNNVEEFTATKLSWSTPPEVPRSRNKTVRIPKSTIKRKNSVVVDSIDSKRTRVIEPDKIDTCKPLQILPPTDDTLSPLHTRRRGKGDGLGCSLDCGPVNHDLLVVSTFFRQNQKTLKDLPDLRKHVTDYCFLDDYGLNATDTVAFYDKVDRLTRDDICSMHPMLHMYSAVIECWSKFLNNLEINDKRDLKRAFLGIKHSDSILRILNNMEEELTPSNTPYDSYFAYWDTFTRKHGADFFLKSDLLFVPLKLDNHFFCICINFPNNTVDLLDYYKHPDPKSSEVYKAAVVLAGCISDYYATKHPSQSFPTEVRFIKFKWLTTKPNDTESGTIMMMYMLMYEGNSFTHPDMENKVARRFLIVNLAATLILADMNLHRATFLKDVQNFVAIKDKIRNKVYESRKIADILAKKKK